MTSSPSRSRADLGPGQDHLQGRGPDQNKNQTREEDLEVAVDFLVPRAQKDLLLI